MEPPQKPLLSISSVKLQEIIREVKLSEPNISQIEMEQDLYFCVFRDFSRTFHLRHNLKKTKPRLRVSKIHFRCKIHTFSCEVQAPCMAVVLINFKIVDSWILNFKLKSLIVVKTDVRSFIRSWFFDVELVIILVVHYVFQTNNASLRISNDAPPLVRRIGDIEDLRNLFCYDDGSSRYAVCARSNVVKPYLSTLTCERLTQLQQNDGILNFT